jgi:hypothetical protein
MSESEITSSNASTDTSLPLNPDEIHRLQQLKKFGDKRIERAVQKVEGLSAVDEEDHKRGQRGLDRQTIGNIRRAFYWVCFALIVFFIICVSILFIDWIHSFFGNAEKIGSFLSTCANYILVIFATLFVESMVRGGDR